jgi:hypothetical protein
MIRLTFGFFSLLLFFHGFFYFLFSLSFHALGRADNALFLVSTLQGSTKPTMLTLELIKKMGELVCFQDCPQFIDASSIFTEFEQQR